MPDNADLLKSIKQYQDLLKYREAKLSLVIKILRGFVWECDEEGNFLFISEQFQQIFAQDQNKVPLPLKFEELVAKDDLQRFQEWYPKLKEHPSTRKKNWFHLQRGTKVFLFSLQATVCLFEQKNIFMGHAEVVDVQHLINQYTQTPMAKINIRHMAHKFNNLLTILQGKSLSIKQNLEGHTLTPENETRMIESILLNINKTILMVKKFTAFAQESTIEDIEIVQTCREITKMFEYELSLQKTKIEFQTTKNEFIIQGKRHDLEQFIIDLINICGQKIQHPIQKIILELATKGENKIELTIAINRPQEESFEEQILYLLEKNHQTFLDSGASVSQQFKEENYILCILWQTRPPNAQRT